MSNNLKNTLKAELAEKLAAHEAAEAKRNAKMSSRKQLGIAVGSVGVAVLMLSVVHCTEAIAALTGTPWVLATLLAIGIDAGMVACELAGIAASDDKYVRRWSMSYIILAVCLSCLLNGWASAHRAEADLKVAAWVVGGLIPVMVFILGKVAGCLWEAPEHVSA